jgi:hypothetical protein
MFRNERVPRRSRPRNTGLTTKLEQVECEPGRAATLQFALNANRISRPGPAAFSRVRHSATPSGDAYTFS